MGKTSTGHFLIYANRGLLFVLAALVLFSLVTYNHESFVASSHYAIRDVVIDTPQKNIFAGGEEDWKNELQNSTTAQPEIPQSGFIKIENIKGFFSEQDYIAVDKKADPQQDTKIITTGINEGA